jgi:hypothetical protein
MANRLPSARLFIKAGCSAWLILGSVAVLPVVINALWNLVQKNLMYGSFRCTA